MLSMLYTLGGIFALLVLLALAITIYNSFSEKQKTATRRKTAVFCYAALLVQFFITVTAFVIYRQSIAPGSEYGDAINTQEPSITAGTISESTITEPIAETTVYSDPRQNFIPKASLLSNPENFQITWEINVDGENVDSFIRQSPICFELDQEYFALPGISTFRGDNYRTGATYGTAEIEKESMEIVWSHPIGSLNKWGGCAWTGQPLVVQWDPETKDSMNLYDNKKAKDGLVEVIYAALDGNIHFYDLEDGKPTRNAINMGMNFKCSGSLDPRGYPLLYVGSGLYLNGAPPRMFIVNLITGKIIYEHGYNDPFALREWSAFDSAPLVDAESDTLIWPGDNGVLYTIKLNTVYDKEAGTISVTPDSPVKTRYTSYYSEEEDRYLGYQASASIVDHYLFNAENGGLIQCVDLNSMNLIWAQDLKDDSNSSPVFEWGKDGQGYLYTAPSLHWTAQGNDGSVSICKLDAATGEILWEYKSQCVRYDDISGGVQCTPLLGKEGTNISGLIIYAIARTPSAYHGVLVALDKDTGEKIWEVSTGNYTWSSPVAFYTEDGHSYIFIANASGVCRLIDGGTGEVLDAFDLSQSVEASPVIFGNMLVIGSREAVYGIKIS